MGYSTKKKTAPIVKNAEYIVRQFYDGFAVYQKAPGEGFKPVGQIRSQSSLGQAIVESFKEYMKEQEPYIFDEEQPWFYLEPKVGRILALMIALGVKHRVFSDAFVLAEQTQFFSNFRKRDFDAIVKKLDVLYLAEKVSIKKEEKEE
jgi:hypothetical protein